MDLKIKDCPNLVLDTDCPNLVLDTVRLQLLEYIESTGIQRIDTGISFPKGFRIVTKLTETGLFSNSYRDFAGAFQSTYHNIIRIKSGQWNPCVGNDGDTRYGSVSPNTSYEIDISNANNKYNVIVDGIILANNVPVSGSYSSLTCWLFALHRTDGTDYQPFCGRMGEIKLFDENNVLKADFLPAKDTNGVVCLYDTVSQTFFYNQGTGDFIAGPEIQSHMFMPDTLMICCESFYHKNVPNLNFLSGVSSILEYQRTHQDEVKDYYYPTTPLWHSITTQYPDIIPYYNQNHHLATVICESSDPYQFTQDFLAYISQYPEYLDLVLQNPDFLYYFIDYPDFSSVIIQYPNSIPVLREWPPLLNSLVDTGYEPRLSNSSSATYIDTGIRTTQNTKIECTFIPSKIANSINASFKDACAIFGSAYDYRTHGVEYNTAANWFMFNCAYKSTTSVSASTVSPNVVIADKNELYLNGQKLYTSSTTTFTSTRNLLFFRQRAVTGYAPLVIISASVSENDVPILKLVPFYRNGHYGMIDIINAIFYPNAGTGEFTYSLEPKSSN